MTTLPNQNVNPAPRLIWTGASGTKYEFEHYAIGTVFNAVGGVYIFDKLAPTGRWEAVYIGETDNFLRRLTNELAAHHRWDAVCRAGATHISALIVPGGDAARVAVETDLRHSNNPPCNRQ